MNQWIDFKALRARLDFEQVLRHYGVEVKRKGQQHHGYCPLPNHVGKRNSPSFSANLDRGIFQCFGCGAKGNILEFAVLMEKADPKDGAVLHRVAQELQKRFCPDIPSPPARSEQSVRKADAPKPQTHGDAEVLVNVPLDFELKGLNKTHPYLLNRGFTSETIECFELGYCSRGMLRERIAIPLHDSDAHLVGYHAEGFSAQGDVCLLTRVTRVSVFSRASTGFARHEQLPVLARPLTQAQVLGCLAGWRGSRRRGQGG